MVNTAKLGRPTATMLSAAALGSKAMVILCATSCVAFTIVPPPSSSRSIHRADSIVAFVPIGGTSSDCNSDRIVSLRYRNGDDDQPVDMQEANAEAVKRSNVAPPTQGWTGDDIDMTPWMVASSPGQSISSECVNTSEVDEEQEEAVNEYLDYVNRRNSRLRRRSPKSYHNRDARDDHTTRNVASPSSSGCLEDGYSNALNRGFKFDNIDMSPWMASRSVRLTSHSSRPGIPLRAFAASSLRLVTNVLSVRVIPELFVNNFSGVSLVVLLLLGPVFKVALRQA